VALPDLPPDAVPVGGRIAHAHDDLRRLFAQFATGECRGYSPFYEAIALRIADDAEVLRLSAGARPEQRPPNLLFGATHLLVLRGEAPRLAPWYERLRRGEGVAGDDAWPDFRATCLEHARVLAETVATRRVQTNEAGRIVALRPAIATAFDPLPAAGVALVEVGASAGLNLYMDAHRCRYRLADGSTKESGPHDARLVVDCELRGAGVPPLSFPRVASRRGVDLDPVDVTDDDAVLWLRALVWPDQPGRDLRLRAAVETVREDPPAIERGDAVEVLPRILASLPRGAPACVYHSAVRHQLTRAQCQALDRAVDDANRDRPTAYVQAESPAGGPFDLLVRPPGERNARLVGRSHAHGAWVEWLA